MKFTALPVYCLFLLLFTCSDLTAQSGLSKVYLIQQMDHFKSSGQQIPVDQFFERMQEQFRLSPDSKMELQKRQAGYRGFEHHKFQQFHKDIPVFGATYRLHSQNGLVQSANGYFRPLLDLNTRAKISEAEAIQRAMQAHQAKTYSWEKTNTHLSHQDQKPKADLYILDPSFPQVSESAVLVYQVDLHSLEPFDKQRYFVNAQTGRIEKKWPLLHPHAVPAKAKTKYYGEQDIIVDSIGPSEFHLHDPTRGNGISTFNSDQTIFQNNSTYWDLTNEDQDEVALDAHYCAEKFYDFLLDEYQWNGLGNNGESMNSIVHIGNGASIINAFWDGQSAWFGDGDCNNGPLTTYEVVGHEFTHGIIDYTSNLIYADESGAINESLADVFGKMLEYTEDPNNFVWSIGQSFRYIPGAEPFRSMSDPSSRGHPDFYKGSLWQDGAGVHTNSSVGNHWFYLMSEGEMGVNEIGEAYDVNAIGIEKAGALIFLANRVYLSEGSQYNDYYELSILAAEELYGVNSAEVATVKEAWKAVGVPASNQTPDVLDLTIATSDAFRSIDTCQHEGFFPIEFMVMNVGNKTYTPQADDEVTVSYFDESGPISTTVALTETILPGESITFVVDNLIFVDKYINTNFTYRLPNNIDDNFSNNTFYSFFTNWFYEEKEVQMSAYTEGFNCETNEHEVVFSLFNRSCSPISSNTPMTISIIDSLGQIYWSEIFALGFPIFPGGVQNFQHNVSFEWKEDFLMMLLQLDGDPDLSNNISIVDFWEPNTFDISSTNGFNNTNELDLVQVNSSISVPLYQDNNESYFISTGRTQVPSNPSCFNPLDNLEIPMSFSSTVQGILNVCVDLVGHKEAKLEFDLIQYRNDDLEDPFPESSMLQVSWEGLEPGKEIIFGQAEGESVHHEIDLPDDFFGAIEFKFSTYSGTNLNNSALLDFDVMLFDNLSFSSLNVGTENLSEIPLKIIPNPVSHQLYLETSMEVEEIIITNIQGQQIYQDAQFDGSPIDLSQLSNGYYFLSAFNKKLGKRILPFVKSE